ncbi:hypothetical protein Droror1_Dr00001483 [Drosera rotundifolia]
MILHLSFNSLKPSAQQIRTRAAILALPTQTLIPTNPQHHETLTHEVKPRATPTNPIFEPPRRDQPDTKPHSLSIVATEVLHSNLLIKLRADDIDCGVPDLQRREQ